MFRLSAVAFVALSAPLVHWSRASFDDLRMEEYAPR